MTHRDGLPGFSARSVGCGDAGHHKARATPSENLGKALFRAHARPPRARSRDPQRARLLASSTSKFSTTYAPVPVIREDRPKNHWARPGSGRCRSRRAASSGPGAAGDWPASWEKICRQKADSARAGR